MKEQRQKLKPLLIDVAIFNLVLMAAVHLLVNEILISNVSTIIPIYVIVPRILYHVFWIIPVLVLSLLFNTAYLEDVAEIIQPATEVFSGLMDIIKEKLGTLGTKIALNIFMFLLANFIPYIGVPLSFIYAALYWAFACYEFRWIHDGMAFQNRMEYFETRWPYFLGFGVIIELIFETLPIFIAMGVTGFYFMIMMILAMEAPER